MKVLIHVTAILLMSVSSSGQSWTRLSSINEGGPIYSLPADPPILFIQNKRSTDGGYTWKVLNYPSSISWIVPTVIHPVDSSTIFFRSYEAKTRTFRSIDAGGTLDEMTTAPSGMTYFAIDPNAPLDFFAQVVSSRDGLTEYSDYISTDGGNSWQEANIPATKGQYPATNATQPHNADVRYLAFHPNRPNLCFKHRYAWYDNGSERLWEIDHFLWTSQGPLAGGIPSLGYNSASGAITTISFSPATGDTLFIVAPHILEVSTDLGYSLETIFKDDSKNITGFFFQSNERTCWMSQDSLGVFASTDFGNTWASRNNGLLTDSIRALHQDQLGNIYAMTTEGFYRWSEVTRSPVVPEIYSFSLSSAYPNPFSGSTSIEYSLPAQQHISLDVYNTLGRKVKTLYNGHRDPGTHTARLDASALPAGTYRVVLRSAEGMKTQMVVVR